MCFIDREVGIAKTYSKMTIPMDRDDDCQTDDECIKLATKKMFNDMLNHMY